MATALGPLSKSFSLKNPLCPCWFSKTLYKVACGERDIQQGGISGDGEGGRSGDEEGKK